MCARMNITVAGLGYVGLSNAVLLSQTHTVVAYDIDSSKVECIEKKVSPFNDSLITEYLSDRELDIIVTTDFQKALSKAEIFIIATPTDFIEKNNSYDTSSIESIIEKIISTDKRPLIVIKSTVPIGYTEELRKKFKYERIVFSPEFLREGLALHDCLFPSRIIVSNEDCDSKKISEIFKKLSLNESVKTLHPSSSEAESIKLFSNAYLAMRVAFFNELDTFSQVNTLNPRSIIEGVCLDPRIGDFYNNPSFGYGGYCLPKDSKQLISSYKDIPNNLISSIVKSNTTRIEFIANSIASLYPETIGIYRLIMKQGSDNYRSSSIIKVVEKLREYNLHILIYEPNLNEETFMGISVINDLSFFKEKSSLIISNRANNDLLDVQNKLFTRDIFGID